MLTTFRTYQLAKDLYQSCQGLKVPHYVHDQFMRAALSVCLNLSEGSAKPTKKDRKKFYFIALGSLREVQTCLELHGNEDIRIKADTVAAHCYRLCYSLSTP